MTMKSNETSEQQLPRQQIAKARWSILRKALLLQNKNDQFSENQHSIHRYGGYNLLQGRLFDASASASLSSSSSLPPDLNRIIESLLSEYRWNVQKTLQENLDDLEIAVLALSACFPKAKCIRIVDVNNNNDNNSTNNLHSSSPPECCWLTLLQERCQPSVRVLKVAEKEMMTTLLVQETSNSTRYKTIVYDLNANTNTKKDGNYQCMTIWTRQPTVKRLSLDELVSHRKNKGVDNTGNICVWDSERTLAYLLYNDFDAFFTLTETGVIEGNTYRILPHGDDPNNTEIRIMSLGSGMAGIAGVALGYRVETLLRQQRNDAKFENKRKSVRVTLTDGNIECVLNNKINQYLTELSSQTWRTKTSESNKSNTNNNHSCQHRTNLTINCEYLLWTTDCCGDIDGSFSVGNNEQGKERRWRERPQNSHQDMILISDCVHFQNFHAALIITTMRCLRVGGTAIFCQPTRNPSLDNFSNLLTILSSSTTAATVDKSDRLSFQPPLLHLEWMKHPVLEQKHKEASSNHTDTYDENLHRPKLLVVTKMREMLEDDRLHFITYHQRYSNAKQKY